MLKWVMIACVVFASSTGDILCAKGMSEGRELSDFRPSGILHAIEYIFTRRLVILGYLSYAVAFFSLMGLLSLTQLSVAVPATALSFVIDTLGAHFILHEHIPWKRWVGVVCVSAGVVLVIKPAPAPPPLARPAWTRCVPVQTCQNQTHNHQPGAQSFHH